MLLRSSRLALLGTCFLGLTLIGCSDEGETTTSSTSVGVGGGTTTSATGGGGASSAGGGGTGGATNGTGGGGTGGGGTGGAPAFGPCQGLVDDFDAFVLASTTDPWESDDVIALTNGLDKAISAQPDGDNYAGLYTATPAVAQNCFFGVAVEDPQQEAGFYILEVLEQGDTGRKLVIEVTPGQFAVANVLDAMGNADTLGTGALPQDLRGMRIQILAGQVLFEVKDTTGWHAAATLDTPPTWLSAPVLVGFGYRSVAPGEEARFDDFSVESPL